MSEQLNHRLVMIIAIGVMLAIFTAYMIFLAYTWQQLQRDRSVALSKVDEFLDRLPKTGTSNAPAPAVE